MEASAKKPVSRLREVIQVPKRVAWDPRFESLCGNLDTKGSRRDNFLYENELPAEREELKRLMKKSNDPATIDELKNHISGIDEQVKSVPKHTDRNILAEHKQKERGATKQGKRPFYLKKSEIWKQSLVEKYKELKAAGKLESYIEKREGRMLQKTVDFGVET